MSAGKRARARKNPSNTAIIWKTVAAAAFPSRTFSLKLYSFSFANIFYTTVLFIPHPIQFHMRFLLYGGGRSKYVKTEFYPKFGIKNRHRGSGTDFVFLVFYDFNYSSRAPVPPVGAAALSVSADLSHFRIANALTAAAAIRQASEIARATSLMISAFPVKE